LRIVFDKNVPVGVRRFLTKHEVRTFVEMQWHPQLENGELLKAAEASGFDVMVTSDQNIISGTSKPDRPETRLRRTRVQYLARGVWSRSSDSGQS
jgi:hypothetical protein